MKRDVLEVLDEKIKMLEEADMPATASWYKKERKQKELELL